MRIMNKLIRGKKFTLIELIVVIGILAILASLVAPNIKGIEGEARGAALATERKSVQTAVDMYMVDHVEKPVLADETTGEVEDIIMENPGIISMDKLYPEYLRDFPSTADAKYWLDYSGKVWVSLADAPVVTNNNGILSWDAVDGAVEYIVYEYSNVNSNMKYNLSEVARVSEPGYSGISGVKYAVQSVDKQGNKSVLAGVGYAGYPVEAAGEDGQDALVKTADQIDAGAFHTLVKTTDGDLYVFGYNGFGQLGNGGTTNSLIPTKVSAFDSNVASVAAGYGHTLVKTTDGNLYTFGLNSRGELGDGGTTNNPIPKKVSAFNGNVASVAAGGNHSLVKTTDGDLYAFGSNGHGQLGDGGTTNNPIPTKVSAFNGNVGSIGVGNGHTLVKTTDGNLYAFGINNSGQLGNGGTTNNPIPTKVSAFNGNVASVSVGGNQNLVKTTDGNLYVFGRNHVGQLGDGGIINSLIPKKLSAFNGNVASVAAGDRHTLVKTTDGNLYAFGRNHVGQLGDGGTTNSLTPTIVDTFNGNVASVAAGIAHTLVKTTDGNLYAFGRNHVGQLGDGGTTERHSPVPITIE